MQDYFDGFEGIFSRLAPVGSAIARDLKVAMLVVPVGGKTPSPYGHEIPSLQVLQGKVTWQTSTAMLTQ